MRTRQLLDGLKPKGYSLVEGNRTIVQVHSFHFVNFRVNPIREAEGNMPASEILEMLHKHVKNMYPSIKQAFLAFDEVGHMHPTHGYHMGITLLSYGYHMYASSNVKNMYPSIEQAFLAFDEVGHMYTTQI